MPSTAWPSAILSSISRSSGCSAASTRARSRTSSVRSSSRHGGAQRPACDLLERALVGDGERPDLLDGVAPELDPERMLARRAGRRRRCHRARRTRHAARRGRPGGRPPRPGGARRPRGRPRRPRGADTGSRSAKPLDLRLQDRPHGRDDHLDRPTTSERRSGWTSRRRTASRCADGVRPRREPLVRKGLPRREVDHRRRGSSSDSSGLDELVGLARGRGHDEHGSVGAWPASARPSAAATKGRMRVGCGEIEGGGAAGTVGAGSSRAPARDSARPRRRRRGHAGVIAARSDQRIGARTAYWPCSAQ